MSVKQVHITLRGALEGQTILLNEYQFTDGIFHDSGDSNGCKGLATYFQNSYNCEAWIGELSETPPVRENTILMNNDPEYLKRLKAMDEEDEVEEAAEAEPTKREQNLIEAINLVEEDWIMDVVPHPAVTKVAEIIDEPTLTKEEVVAAVEKWNLSPNPAPEDEDTKE